jgi:hypothetical protein
MRGAGATTIRPADLHARARLPGGHVELPVATPPAFGRHPRRGEIWAKRLDNAPAMGQNLSRRAAVFVGRVIHRIEAMPRAPRPREIGETR